MVLMRSEGKIEWLLELGPIVKQRQPMVIWEARRSLVNRRLYHFIIRYNVKHFKGS